MQIFNIITNIFTIVGTIVGCAMFYFTFKNHQWLVEDRKKQIEQEIRNKLNKIFSIVAECLIYQQHVHEKVPKEIVEFIHQDIDYDISVLQRKMQSQIDDAKQQNEFDKKHDIENNINRFNSAYAIHEYCSQYNTKIQLETREIERNFIAEQQKILKEIISQYRNGNRLNDIDFNKLRSYFKDNKQIEECYKLIMKNC